MKKIIVSLFAAVTLVSLSSVASLVQPGRPVDEDTGFRVNGGVKGGIHNATTGYGLSNIGLGLGFAHNLGYDFEWGMSVSGDWASRDGRVFSDGRDGARVDGEIMGRYMPEFAERFNFGAHMAVNYGRQFGQAAQAYNSEASFGDLGFTVGLGVNYGFNDSVAVYFMPAYSMSSIRFGVADAARANTYLSGIELPLGMWFNVTEDTGVFIEANSKFTNLSNFTRSFREDLTLGVSFAI